MLWYSNAVWGGPTGIFKRQKITIFTRFSYAATQNLSRQYRQTIKIDNKLVTVIVLYFHVLCKNGICFNTCFFQTKILSRNTKLCTEVTCQCFFK